MRLLAALLALLFLTLTAYLAQAASFDCTQAETSLETAICGYEPLSEADEVLATAYATAIGGLSKAATNAMRADQREWLDYAAYVCIEEADDDAPDTRGNCLTALFQDRIATLEASRMRSGRRIYISTSYDAAPDPQAEADSPWRIATHEITLAQMDGDSALADGFNAMIQAARDDYGWFYPGTEQDASSDTVLTGTVETLLPRRITVRFGGYWYGHGAAHGNYSIEFLHYLPDENRLMTAEDVFSAPGWRETLLDLTVAALKDEHGENLMLDNPQDIAEAVADPRRWLFGDYGLVIQFQPYEVSAYAYGAPTATVRWEDIADLMAESADAIRWGY